MNFGQAEAAVRKYFNAQWDKLTDIAWPDMDFDTPNETWVRFSMKNNDGFQASFGNPGNNRFRRKGMVYVQVFQKEGKGSTDARAKADVAADIFMADELSGVTFYNVNAKDIGPDGNGWYQWNVSAEFRYDRIT